jgi:hypothetical protein
MKITIHKPKGRLTPFYTLDTLSYIGEEAHQESTIFERRSEAELIDLVRVLNDIKYAIDSIGITKTEDLVKHLQRVLYYKEDFCRDAIKHYVRFVDQDETTVGRFSSYEVSYTDEAGAVHPCTVTVTD